MTINILKHRRNLIPYLAKKIKARTYLEIGVKGGKTFLPIPVRKKYAVDPNFKIKPAYKRKQLLFYFPNLFAKYFDCTSDYFFEKYAPKTIKLKQLDLAFLDGLHTFEQVYKDIINTLPYMSDKGIIILHDCSPKSYAAAYPAGNIDEVKKINPKGFAGMWSGDVWKAIPQLRVSHPELEIFVIDNDSGLGIISKRPLFKNKAKIFETPLNDITDWQYEYLERNRGEILNIISDQKLLETCLIFR